MRDTFEVFGKKFVVEFSDYTFEVWGDSIRCMKLSRSSSGAITDHVIYAN